MSNDEKNPLNSETGFEVKITQFSTPINQLKWQTGKQAFDNS